MAKTREQQRKEFEEWYDKEFDISYIHAHGSEAQKGFEPLGSVLSRNSGELVNVALQKSQKTANELDFDPTNPKHVEFLKMRGNLEATQHNRRTQDKI